MDGVGCSGVEGPEAEGDMCEDVEASDDMLKICSELVSCSCWVVG